MSYLQERKIRRSKFLKYAFVAVVLVLCIYFRDGISNGLSFASHAVFSPVWRLGNNIEDKLSVVSVYFSQKKSLFSENENLRSELDREISRTANYNSILNENVLLKEILNRKDEKKPMILAAVLSSPSRSPYDTLIIDAGAKHGILFGQNVFASGDIPIGTVEEVYADTSKVVLFSSQGEKTETVLSGDGLSGTGGNVFAQIIGRGGGNFEMIMPRDFPLEKGMEVSLPGILPRVIAKVRAIISDPRDSYQKALLLSPVNIFELKFVGVEK